MPYLTTTKKDRFPDKNATKDGVKLSNTIVFQQFTKMLLTCLPDELMKKYLRTKKKMLKWLKKYCRLNKKK